MFVIQAGHENINSNCDATRHGETGAPGEINWTPQIVDRVVGILNTHGVASRHVDANFNCAGDSNALYDGFIAVHYQSDPPHESGFFVGTMNPTEDQSPEASGRLRDAISTQYAASTGLQQRDNWNSDNIREYYMFFALNGQTPCALIECGTGAVNAPDHDLLWGEMDTVAHGIANGILQFAGHAPVEPPAPPSPPEPPAPVTSFEQDVIDLVRMIGDGAIAFLAKHGA